MNHRVGASGVGHRPRHLSLEQNEVHRAPLPGLRRPHRSSTGSPQLLTPLKINTSLLARATSVAPFGQRRLVVVTKDAGATWSSPIDVTGMTGSDPEAHLVSFRDVEHSIVQIFQAQASTFKLIGWPVSDDKLYSLVEHGGSGSVIWIAIVEPLQQQFPPWPWAHVETSGAGPNLPPQEPSSPVSPYRSTEYDASDEGAGSRRNYARLPRAQGDVVNSPFARMPRSRTTSFRQGKTASTMQPFVRPQQHSFDTPRRTQRQNVLTEPTPPSSRNGRLADTNRQYQTDPSRSAETCTVTRPSDIELGQRSFVGLQQHLKRHGYTHPALRAFLLSSSDASFAEFRTRTATLGADQLEALTSMLQNCISQCELREGQEQALKLLQDICPSSLMFPPSFWITGVVRGRRIAAGGEATTFDGTHRGRPVVIRLYHPPKAGGWEDQDGQSVLKLIIREAVVHRQLSHKNIVDFVGIWKSPDEGVPSIVLQKGCHGSVHAYLHQQETPDAFVKLVKGMIAGLCYLHSRDPPVIHGDIHDDNVLADESGEALLCDFGLCRIRYEISRTHTEIRQGGRVRFVAPELWSGQRPLRINEASDTYSLAMTIYALGTHRRPLFKYDNDFAVVNAIQTGARPEQPESLGGLPPHKTEELWKIMSAMWAQDPDRRSSMHLVKARFYMLFGGSDAV